MIEKKISNQYHGSLVRWTQDDCKQAIQVFEQYCKDNGKRPTQNNYRVYCLGNGSIPSLQTISRLFLSWNKARLYASGEETLVSLNVPGQRRKWQEELCLEAIRKYEEFCQKTGVSASRDGYQTWHRQNPGTPSIAPIEQLGRWNEMRLRSAHDPKNIQVVLLHQKKWSEERCLQAVKRYKEDCRVLKKQCTLDGYDAWHIAHPDTPCIRTIKKWGSWKSLLQRAEDFRCHVEHLP